MKRLAAWLLTAFFLTLLLLGAVVSMTRIASPGAALLARYDLGVCASGEPCFMGIVPGQTSYPVAEQIIARKQPGWVPERGEVWLRVPDRLDILRAQVGADFSGVKSINARVAIPLWAVIATYGQPCRVVLIATEKTAYQVAMIIYPFMALETTYVGNSAPSLTRITPELRLSQVILRSPDLHESPEGNCRSHAENWYALENRWRGYASFAYYRSQAGR